MKIEFNLEQITLIRRSMMYLLDTLIDSPYDSLYEVIGETPAESIVEMFFTEDAARNEYACVVDDLTTAEEAIKALEYIDSEIASVYKTRLDNANKYADHAYEVLKRQYN